MLDSIIEFIKTFVMLFFELLTLFISRELYCKFNPANRKRKSKHF